ncbi:hypothetical protein B4096_1981 [Heyndrickxia coagulans]|nr:hypothetical protein B4096_1981 [Heyndrickxia coagulans]
MSKNCIARLMYIRRDHGGFIRCLPAIQKDESKNNKFSLKCVCFFAIFVIS